MKPELLLFPAALTGFMAMLGVMRAMIFLLDLGLRQFDRKETHR